MKKIIIDFNDIKHFDDIDSDLLNEGFIFNDFCIVLKNHPGLRHDFKITVYFDTEKHNMQFGVFDPHFNVHHYWFGYDVMQGYIFGRIDDDFEDNEEEACTELINIILDIVMTIKEASYNRAISYKKNEELKQEVVTELNRLKKKKKKMKVQDIMLFDELCYFASVNVPEEKLKRHFNCPVWDVRGFYRHYKNGTVKWINSFQKGRDRNKGLSGKDRTYIADKRDKNI